MCGHLGEYACSRAYCTGPVQVVTEKVEQVIHVPASTTTKDIYECVKCGAQKDR